ncbi:MAG: hypothetical protein CSA82_02875 [Actinobacteria bacterium]|nr:MAG: hypothetical protein CSA82_02875 [Actinomycetota bacterium]
MESAHDIDSLGFYPNLVKRLLNRALGGQPPAAMLSQLDAAFDHGSMFRHLTIVAFSSALFTHLHIDELESGGAMATSAVYPLSELRTVSMAEMVADPENEYPTTTEVTLSLNLGAQRRGEVETLRCNDENCTADHGFSVTTFPEDVNFRISAAADGGEVLKRAQVFVDLLCAMMEQNNA